ncbi:hypothetical protein [Conchiformibius kuhniae]|uniref:Beta-ketoacyl synthase N-terminal domain-containing protein n=1 Tax=Conchiformibius kuhniae TaxID=211502 RepID=A0A8T9MWG3_9NEIS|nr:hypothetical protein [Conchiformibius kuhniae]UOP05501.1 hypothetical protein LVJ77_05025 [Conchiformibius kuhniae]
MNTTLYVQIDGTSQAPSVPERADCLQHTDTRRLSRATLLVLAGALPLCGGLPARTALYAVSPFGSAQRFARLCDKFQAGVPSPLDFVAQLHNAPLFHLAQTAGICGESILLAAETDGLTQHLRLAALALHGGAADTVLAGWLYEPRRPHERETGIWWRLSRADTPFDAPATPLPDPATAFPEAAQRLHDGLLRHGALALPASGGLPAVTLHLPAPSAHRQCA